LWGIVEASSMVSSGSTAQDASSLGKKIDADSVRVDTLLALICGDPQRAKERLPNYRLTRLVAARVGMDEAEVKSLADLTGDPVSEPFWHPSKAFEGQLRETIGRYGLAPLFRDDGPGPYHHAIRPTGYDYYADEVEPVGMEDWRAAYRALATEHQMIAASIIWLYRARKDNIWLRRVPCTWHAADALAVMRRRGVLPDWARLMTLYPGW
jgi:hypothetical protein